MLSVRSAARAALPPRASRPPPSPASRPRGPGGLRAPRRDTAAPPPTLGRGGSATRGPLEPRFSPTRPGARDAHVAPPPAPASLRPSHRSAGVPRGRADPLGTALPLRQTVRLGEAVPAICCSQIETGAGDEKLTGGGGGVVVRKKKKKNYFSPFRFNGWWE